MRQALAALLASVVASVVAAGALAACSAGKSGAVASKEVTGTLTIDGKPVTITKCLVEKHLDTRLSLIFAGGSIALEDDELYLHQGENDDGMMKGNQLSCGEIKGQHYLGTSTDKPGWFSGTLAGECSGPAKVVMDLTLECNTSSPEVTKQIDELKADQAKFGQDLAGSAAGSDGTGSAAPAAGSGSAAPGSGAN